MYIRAYERLFKYLSQLVLGRKFFSSESNRLALKASIESSFSLLFWIAKKINKSTADAQALFNKYKENYFADEAKLINEDYEINSAEDLNDNVNYLKICVQNVCDLDLDNLSEEELDKEPYQEKPTATAVYKNFFNIIDVNAPIGKAIDDLVLRSHAWERLNHDIKSGAIYIYKTKPKRNLIIKIILSYLLFFGSVTALTLLVSCFFNGNLDQDKAQLMIVSGLAFLYFSFGLHYARKSFGNDNFKYSFHRNEFYYTFFFALFFSFALSSSTGEGFLLKNSLNYWNKGLWIGLLCITILICLIYLVSYLYFQPEEDKKLVENTLEKHLADISKRSTLSN